MMKQMILIPTAFDRKFMLCANAINFSSVSWQSDFDPNPKYKKGGISI